MNLSGFIDAQIKDFGKKLLKRFRENQLRPGESGWGKPNPLPPYLPDVASDKRHKVAVIGMGNQGIAQCQGFMMIKGVTIAGIADINAERLNTAKNKFKLPDDTVFADAATMLKSIGEVSLVSIATTAPYHIQLGRLALEHGAKCIMLEKPVDISLTESKKFKDECIAAGVKLFVNYSRRFTIDHRSIKRVIDKGYIGDVKSISFEIGKGELAMIGSHYFDFSRMILSDKKPSTVEARLEPLLGENRRGGNYTDPFGYCLFIFENGERAYFDFSSDLEVKDSQVFIKGTKGYIFIDETNMNWNIQVRGQKLWSVPFAEPMKSSVMFSRSAAAALSGKDPYCTVDDGIAALEMILGAHLSSSRGGARVSFPLSETDVDMNIVFP
jgi:predicted dehydrogenase